MGAAIGIPFVAADKRLSAAVFGLVGTDTVGEAAGEVTVPVQFVLQLDDEAIPRSSALAVFDAFATLEKTLHANPGGHAGVPMFEVDDAVRFLQRRLHSATATEAPGRPTPA